ncbi:Bardet-Biedl syndrome 1 protein isoform X2 [Daktulosphaira vitifoliae]|uniref:Bardet-Biedl syndrome 1 protein isoform X2 n=1 Tax=Daktulosphaira vitifoliae TaxID=58002 RepID=UPI0021A98C2A|nr:Bardet-Biedl syndrome 1 protein isoform X2 [Daktulosphaira vitifoliae]
MSLNRNSTWIDVDINPPVFLQTYNCFTTLVDVHGDKDNKFVVIDFGSGTTNPQLKVFKGINQTHVVFFYDKPSAILAVYIDNKEHHVPCIAVAIKNEIYFYRNCKPYYKYSIQPALVNNEDESKIWRDAEKSSELLSNLQALATSIGFAKLSTTSQQLLCCHENQIENFFNNHKKQKLVKQHNISCITELKRRMNEVFGVSCIVIATTDTISILDTESFKMLPDKYEFQGDAVYLAANGIYDVDYKILVATRTGRVYIFSKSSTSGYKVEMTHAIVAIILRIDKFICCTLDGVLQCYSLKCISLWNIKLPGDPTAMVNMYVQSLSLELTVVACRVINTSGHTKGSILLYSGTIVVHKITMPDPIYCMNFGKLGQEENALLMISSKGKLDVKLLKRTATFDLCFRSTNITEPSRNLDIPKRSNIFIEQTLRERECFHEIHVRTQQAWQRFQITILNERMNSIKQKITNKLLHTSAQLPIIIPDKEVSCETFVTCLMHGSIEERVINIVVNQETNILYRAKLNLPIYDLQNNTIENTVCNENSF